MKQRTGGIVLCLATVFTATLYGQAPQCGSQLASYSGVAAFSNGIYQQQPGSCGTYGTYGYQYQCVEYVRRFYEGKGNAWKGNANTYYEPAAANGLIAFPNGGTVPPAPNDIMVFDGDKYGHVAIVTDVSGTQVSLIVQNWS
jgi:surface antigen